jgi:hypothetical protein
MYNQTFFFELDLDPWRIKNMELESNDPEFYQTGPIY